MNVYVAEFLGTTILILLGNGVVANVVLRDTKGYGSGWIAISAGWGLAVFVAVLCVGEISGAHINPAVTVGLWAGGEFEADLVPGYLLAQLGGAVVGATLVFVFYYSHFQRTAEPEPKLGTFATGPAVRNLPLNFVSEVIATAVLVLAVLLTVDPSFQFGDEEVPIGLGSLGALRVGLVVFAIGICLGGTTGYAINPARDLGPRLAYAVLPVPGKGSADWSYGWVPVLGPTAGGLLAALIYYAIM